VPLGKKKNVLDPFGGLGGIAENDVHKRERERLYAHGFHQKKERKKGRKTSTTHRKDHSILETSEEKKKREDRRQRY